MRKTFSPFVVATVILTAVVMLASVLLNTAAFASSVTNGKKMIGTATNVSGIIPIPPLSSALPDGSNWGTYVCATVNEKLVYVNGVQYKQDKQNCTFTSLGGSTLPSKATTVSGTFLNPPLLSDGITPMYWLSDYAYATSGALVWADSWSYTTHPDGTLSIVSYYAIPCDTVAYDSSGTQTCP
jgi:hypothetical protein